MSASNDHELVEKIIAANTTLHRALCDFSFEYEGHQTKIFAQDENANTILVHGLIAFVNREKNPPETNRAIQQMAIIMISLDELATDNKLPSIGKLTTSINNSFRQKWRNQNSAERKQHIALINTLYSQYHQLTQILFTNYQNSPNSSLNEKELKTKLSAIISKSSNTKVSLQLLQKKKGQYGEQLNTTSMTQIFELIKQSPNSINILTKIKAINDGNENNIFAWFGPNQNGNNETAVKLHQLLKSFEPTNDGLINFHHNLESLFQAPEERIGMIFSD